MNAHLRPAAVDVKPRFSSPPFIDSFSPSSSRTQIQRVWPSANTRTERSRLQKNKNKPFARSPLRRRRTAKIIQNMRPQHFSIMYRSSEYNGNPHALRNLSPIYLIIMTAFTCGDSVRTRNFFLLRVIVTEGRSEFWKRPLKARPAS